MDSDLKAMIIYFGIAILCVFWGLASNKKRKDINDGNEWFENILSAYKLKSDISTCIIGASDYNNFLIYSEGEFVYICNKINKFFKKISKEDILKVDVDVCSLEKNTKRLVALTSTFDIITLINSVFLKLVSLYETYNIAIMVNGMDGMGKTLINKNAALDDANRIKLILERDINNLINIKN